MTIIPLGPASHCRICYGVLDYIYSTWWKCRDCAKWYNFTPEDR